MGTTGKVKGHYLNTINHQYCPLVHALQDAQEREDYALSSPTAHKFIYTHKQDQPNS